MTGRFNDNVFVFSREQDAQRHLEGLLLRHSDTVRCFSTRQECLRGLRTRPCDLVIIDCDGCVTEELALLAEVRETDQRIAALVLVEPGDVSRAVEAMKRGAFDCLEKPVREEPLQEVMELALNTRQQHAVGLKALTRTEVKVLQLILAGKTTGEIAGALHRSVRTMEVHRGNILRKLGVHGIVDLVKWAVAAGVS